MTELEYKPYRIIYPPIVAGDESELRRDYPSATIHRSPRGSISATWTYMQVVNIPTPAEIELFERTRNRAIPQDERGFDVRDSGVARSVKTSMKAAEEAKIEVAKAKLREKDAERRRKKEEERQNQGVEPEPSGSVQIQPSEDMKDE